MDKKVKIGIGDTLGAYLGIKEPTEEQGTLYLPETGTHIAMSPRKRTEETIAEEARLILRRGSRPPTLKEMVCFVTQMEKEGKPLLEVPELLSGTFSTFGRDVCYTTPQGKRYLMPLSPDTDTDPELRRIRFSYDDLTHTELPVCLKSEGDFMFMIKRKTLNGKGVYYPKIKGIYIISNSLFTRKPQEEMPQYDFLRRTRVREVKAF